jgi:hypothetical protein
VSHPEVGKRADGPYAREDFRSQLTLTSIAGAVGAALLNELAALRGEVNNVADSIDCLAEAVRAAPHVVNVTPSISTTNGVNASSIRSALAEAIRKTTAPRGGPHA